jgi:hypothetical protein
MSKYYYLACALPKISLKTKPEMSFEELVFMLDINLYENDKKKLEILRQFIDINNLRMLWLNEEINNRGNLNKAQLEDVILIKNFFPEFVFDFLDKYEKKEDKIKNFSFLIVSFFNEVIARSSGFLKFYFELERETRLILTALRAKKLSRDISYELQFEDLHDTLVAYILAQKDMESFEPPKKYEKLKNIYKENINDPKNMHLSFLEYKFNKIEKYAQQKPFTIDQILSYVVLLMIVEDFYRLNAEIGKEKIEKL